MEIESYMETSDIVKIWSSNRKFVGYWEEDAPIDWKRENVLRGSANKSRMQFKWGN